MRIFFSVVTLAVIIVLPGCATITYHERFGNAGNEMAEFIDFDEKYRICKGAVTDENFIRHDKKYYHLQFNGALAGTGRIINILIPHEYGSEPEIFETEGTIPEGKKTYLVVVRICCPEEYNRIFDPIDSRETEKNGLLMKKYLAQKFPESSSEDSWPVIFCELSLTNVKTYNLIYKKWDPVSRDGNFSSYGSSLNVSYSRMDLKWEKRSSVKNVMIKAGYIFPVIADIVTSPVQLICFIIYFISGGAVKESKYD